MRISPGRHRPRFEHHVSVRAAAATNLPVLGARRACGRRHSADGGLTAEHWDRVKPSGCALPDACFPSSRQGRYRR